MHAIYRYKDGTEPPELNASALISAGLDANSAMAATAAAVMQSFLSDPQNANSISFQDFNSDTSSNLGRDDEFDLDSGSDARSSSSPNNFSLSNNDDLE